MASVPIVPPMKSAQIENKAMTVLRTCCPHVLESVVPTPVDQIFELYIPEIVHIRTMYTNLKDHGIMDADGYTNARQRISLVDMDLSDDFSDRGRRRFRATVGHEAGHCFLHVDLRRWQQSLQLVGKGMKRDRSSLKFFEDPECQAWRFCHALCMPERSVRLMVKKYGCGEDAIRIMVRVFDMNHSFVETRLRMLKIIPAFGGDRKRGSYLPRISDRAGDLAKP